MSFVKEPSISNLADFLRRNNVMIPNYQRPYKWTSKNVFELLMDIDKAIATHEALPEGSDYRYRIGNIILHEHSSDEKGNKEVVYDIVDGQQRTLTLLIICLYLREESKEFEISESFSNMKFTNSTTIKNINENYKTVKACFSGKDSNYRDKFLKAFTDILEVVVLTVEELSEAFQLFDCQNTRGKPLDPPDLLKAYHLREMKNDEYEMRHAVEKWESHDTQKVNELFCRYLYPIYNWSRKNKTSYFATKDIDIYKGISEDSNYTYAKRLSRAAPYFQIPESFTAGKNFFEMVHYYLDMKSDIEKEIANNKEFIDLKKILTYSKKDGVEGYDFSGVGFSYAKNLFYCALMCYYDRFHNFDPYSIKKLFYWSMMIRVNMQNLGYNTINNYAIGDDESAYTNHEAVFHKITNARTHFEISAMTVEIANSSKKWEKLLNALRNMNGLPIQVETEEAKND